jgi:hypothetical protein
MTKWTPYIDITLPKYPIINIWIQDLIVTAISYESNLLLFHSMLNEADNTDNEVRKNAFKEASVLLYTKITGELLIDNGFNINNI